MCGLRKHSSKDICCPLDRRRSNDTAGRVEIQRQQRCEIICLLPSKTIWKVSMSSESFSFLSLISEHSIHRYVFTGTHELALGPKPLASLMLCCYALYSTVSDLIGLTSSHKRFLPYTYIIPTTHMVLFGMYTSPLPRGNHDDPLVIGDSCGSSSTCPSTHCTQATVMCQNLINSSEVSTIMSTEIDCHVNESKVLIDLFFLYKDAS